MTDASKKLSIVEQLKPFLNNSEIYGRLYADIHDLLEACEWFMAEIKKTESKTLSSDEIENLLIEIDVRFIEHAMFHLSSLRKDLNTILKKFPNEPETDDVRG